MRELEIESFVLRPRLGRRVRGRQGERNKKCGHRLLAHVLLLVPPMPKIVRGFLNVIAAALPAFSLMRRRL